MKVEHRHNLDRLEECKSNSSPRPTSYSEAEVVMTCRGALGFYRQRMNSPLTKDGYVCEMKLWDVIAVCS